jgi:hypothetical protein
MAGVIYLDIDDEITSAAARIRAADEARLALVLPAGSRVATSRINFRLLAREAQARNRHLSIVAPEGSARSLAASAGLPAFASVAEFEETRGSAGSGTPAESNEVPDAEAPPVEYAPNTLDGKAILTPVTAGSAEAIHGRPRSSPAPDLGVRSRPVIDETGPRVRGGLIALVAIMALVGIVAAVGAYLLLPSASIVITPRAESVGPLELTVRADPAAAQADPAAGVVPAQQASIPLTASGEFSATGKKVKETIASGSVTFTNKNNGRAVSIPGGSQVSTRSGVTFVTTATVVVPKAQTHGVILTPGTANAPIRAVVAGTDGNVPAGSITHVSTAVQAKLVNSDDPVNNQAATSGGTHTETKVVAKKDVDGAVATLKKSITTQLDAAVDDPQRLPPGTTAFPDTKAMSEPTPTPDPATLVGKEIEKFTLGMAATGTVTGVDQAQVEQLAEQRIRAGVAPDHDLVAGSISVKVGAGRVTGSSVTFPVTATAKQVKRVDVNKLREAVKGHQVDEARALLAPYGDVMIDLWPSYVTVIPSFDFRLDVRVASTAATEQPAGASSSPPASASPAASQ